MPNPEGKEMYVDCIKSTKLSGYLPCNQTLSYWSDSDRPYNFTVVLSAGILKAIPGQQQAVARETEPAYTPPQPTPTEQTQATEPSEPQKTKAQRTSDAVETGVQVVGGLLNVFNKRKEEKDKKRTTQESSNPEPVASQPNATPQQTEPASTSTQITPSHEGVVQGAIVWHKQQSRMDITSFTQVWVDSTKSQPLSVAQQKWSENLYNPLDALQLESKFKRGKYAYWLHFTLENPSTDTLEVCYKADVGTSIHLYQLSNGNIKTATTRGINTFRHFESPYKILGEFNYIPLKIAPAAKEEIFVRIASKLAINEKFTAELVAPYALLDLAPQWLFRYFMYGATLVSIALFFVFALAQYIQTRYAAFLSYSVYLLLLFFYFLAYFRKSFLVQVSGLYDVINVSPLFYVFISIAYGSVCYELLKKKGKPSPLKGVFIFTGAANVIYLVFNLITEQIDSFWAWEFSYYFRAGVSPLVLLWFYQLYFMKDKIKYYIYVGSLALLLSSLMTLGTAYLYPDTTLMGFELAVLFFHVGIGIEIVVFALALGYKLKQLEIENQQVALVTSMYERSRIATDMHDDLGHDLLKIRTLTEKLKHSLGTGANVSLLDALSEQTKRSIEKTNDIVWALNSQYDEVGCVLPYIRRYCLELLEAKDIKVNFNADQSDNSTHFDSEKRKSLVLVTKEVVNNIVKHAKATEVTVDYKIDTAYLHLSIHDNGCGIQLPVANQFNNGLANMKTRLEKIQGTFDIFNENGTKVLIKVPLKG